MVEGRRGSTRIAVARGSRDLGTRPPRRSVDIIRKVLKTFKSCAARAFDGIKPRQLPLLDDAGLEAFIDLIALCGAQASWPAFASKLIVHHKLPGGLRPNAIIALVARVQRRLRRSMLVARGKERDRAVFCAYKSKSCNRAVWQQPLWSEWAAVQGEMNRAPGARASASLFLDLVKAVEMIRHDRLLDAAVHYGFPHWQLKLCIELYRTPRHLTL